VTRDEPQRHSPMSMIGAAVKEIIGAIISALVVTFVIPITLLATLILVGLGKLVRKAQGKSD
jgi:hypothetical protein